MNIRISEEVKSAVSKRLPVVALESAIITHGLPYPENIETALEVEETVRENGGVPATIGIICGEVIIGLSEHEIETLGRSEKPLKVSTSGIPLAVSKKSNAGTTVSATSFLAECAHIEVFATGGIGGIHRDVIETFDISRDLEELSLRNIVVVSSGIKSILDVRKTLEYLETKGVLVLGYKTQEFPTFYSRGSGIKVDSVDEYEVASIFKAKKELGIAGAILIANPIPQNVEIPYPIMEEWINTALNVLKEQGITGKDVTPFLLKKIFELSEGKTLKANIALIKNNAQVATRIAKEVYKDGLD